MRLAVGAARRSASRSPSAGAAHFPAVRPAESSGYPSDSTHGTQEGRHLDKGGPEPLNWWPKCPQLDPNTLDDGIRETVFLLRNAGYKTFISCEGGRGHAFHEPTIGLKVQEGTSFGSMTGWFRFCNRKGVGSLR
jgi:hypothetical protein